MFGVVDLFTILAGGAWLTKESVKSILELEDNKANARQIFSFIEEHTDEALEAKYRADIDNPENSEQIWRTLELFKRDNPVWCKKHENKGWVGQYTHKYYPPLFGWQDVGKKRIPLHAASSASQSKPMTCEDLNINRGLVLNMLMQTHEKMTVSMARSEAEKKYPLPHSK